MNRRTLLSYMAMAGAIGLVGLPQLPILESKQKMQYKLGKRPAKKGYGLRLRDYVPKGVLPPLPMTGFGHQNYVTDWKMLGNGPDPSNPPQIPDGVGDCAIAGPFHAEMLWNAVAGKKINVDTNTVIKTYSELTGYVLGDESTDNGSIVDDVSNYWQNTGLTDADGNVHKIDAWAKLTPGNMEELLYAIYLFDVVGIGVNFPAEWMAAMDAGKNWDAIPHPNIEGGHYFIGVGWYLGFINAITWGQQVLLTPAGYEQFCDEAVVYVSQERLLANGKDLNGFDLDQLLADFRALPKL